MQSNEIKNLIEIEQKSNEMFEYKPHSNKIYFSCCVNVSQIPSKERNPQLMDFSLLGMELDIPVVLQEGKLEIQIIVRKNIFESLKKSE